MPDARRYRQALHCLQRRISAQQAISRAARGLKDAYAGIGSYDPSVALLRQVRADLEVAIREAEAMANPDDPAVTVNVAARGEPAA